MIKQITMYETSDGKKFSTEELAVSHEFRGRDIEKLSEVLFTQVECIQYKSEAEEIAAYFVDHYNFERKENV